MTERREVDVLVVGAGPGGLAAASLVAEQGRSVLVIDAAARPGGQIWRHAALEHLPRVARSWLTRFNRSGATFLPNAVAVDARDRTLLVDHCGGPLVVRAEHIVIATGARELFLPFPGWTLPNVLGLGGAQALIKSGASFLGKRAVVAGSGPLVLAVSALLRSKGATLLAVTEQASTRSVVSFGRQLWRHPAKLVEAIRYGAMIGATRYRTGVWVEEARGDGQLQEVVLTDGLRKWTVACDVLCAAYGLVPNIELAQILGCRIKDGTVAVDAMQRTSVQHVLCVGEPTGIAGADSALADGERAGRTITGLGYATPRTTSNLTIGMRGAFAPRPELRERVSAQTVICRCEDVRSRQVSRCASTRQARLMARAGMGPCQARVCGPAMQFLFDWPLDPARAPLFPTSIRTLAAVADLNSSPKPEDVVNAKV